jgi:hypothetical protein
MNLNESFEIVIDGKNYALGEDNCDYLENDIDEPVIGIDSSNILNWLKEGKEVNFNLEYYDEPCENCLAGTAEKLKYFEFFEYHFYIFTKKNEYVISNISKDYGNPSITKMFKMDKIDNSYIVSVMICKSCGDYSIEIEQCEV